MTRPIRHILVIALVALYGLATVSGPCGHAWIGSDHHPVASTSADDSGSLKSVGDAADSCPICQFGLQAQLPVVLSTLEPGSLVCPLVFSGQAPVCLQSLPHPTHPRAPPALV